ncbi:MAG: PAS domain-containing sensor histidine kinase [Ignavibacteriae bacterium]|nr:MAG: PAS domain-containing sensor histidine kinase [Ignavibacteriota bacterium]
MFERLLSLLAPPNFGDEEKNRVAEILNIIALSILTGFIILVLQRAIAGQYKLFIQIFSAGVMIILSIVFLRKGQLQWAEGLLLWTLLGFINYLLYTSNGLHNIALLGIPICLVFAGIALRAAFFFAFTVLSILSVVIIGVLEINGMLLDREVVRTTYFDIIDIVVILSVTAVAVRILADNLLRSINKARMNEKDIRDQAVELKESEEKFRTLNEELPNMVFIYKNGKILYVNERCEELIGFTREEIYAPGFDLLTIITPEHRDVVMQKFFQHKIGVDVEPYECTFIGKTNKRIECLQTTKVIHYEGQPAILGIVADLTEFKRAQEAIRESQSRLSSIITSAMESIITLDEHRRIQSFNPASEEMFRCSEAEAIGQSIDRFIALPNSEKNNGNGNGHEPHSIVSLLEGRMRAINGIRTNGESFPIEASISKVISGNEELYTIILRDITERLKSEETQRTLQSQLLQSQKMEAVGSLAGGIAHDFNNILSVIIGNAELVKLKLPPKHRTMKHIEEVISASDRAQELVQQILAFSRKQDTQFRPVRLHYILREGMRLLHASLPATIEIKVDLPVNGPLILGDATQIHQVIMNLCTNAAQAMEGMDGKLILRQKNVVFDDRSILFHPDLKKGTYAMFTVQDTGLGMDGFTLKRIFEPFFTTKAPGKGTGLGLAIVHAIIKNHGGAIKVQSQVGKGTQVDVYLPVYEGEEENSKSEKTKESLGKAERIMIVDDEELLLKTLSETLKGLGYQAFPYMKPAEALRAFEENPGRYDLIITDQTMPHMTGILLAGRIRQVRGDLPIVLMTGYDQLEDPKKLEALGIRTVLLKPFKKAVLGETIKKILETKEVSKPYSPPVKKVRH